MARSEQKIESKQSFFEKKDQKTFAPSLSQPLWNFLDGARCQNSARNKSFLVLFFKKGLLAFTSSAFLMLAFVTGLQAEARLVAGLRAGVFAGGGTASGAIEATHKAIAAGATCLVSLGLSGGLDPSLQPGALMLPGKVLWHGEAYDVDAGLAAAVGGVTCSTVVATDRVAVSVGDKSALWRSTGASAVDLESGAVAEAASKAGIPFAVLRAVCDPAGRDLPPAALLALDDAGAIGIGRIARSVLVHPGQIGALLALAGDARRARSALIRHLAALSAGSALRPWMV